MAADDLTTFLAALESAQVRELRRDERMAAHTSFRIGGPADAFLDPVSVQALAQALRIAAAASVPVTYLGGGTNVLVSDRGIRGLCVRLGRAFDYMHWSPEHEGAVTVEVGAAAKLVRLVRDAVERGLGGLEFAAGIPGTVGGGALMNAGAFGGQIGDAITHVSTVSSAGEIAEFDRSRLDFSYRRLALASDVVITSVSFRLLRSSVGKLRQVVESVQEKRRARQPLGYPNAGSIFKNPPNEFAGRLVERTGLKGTIRGGAQISPEHANFIVNLGDARADDVRELMGLMQDEVWRRSGIWLEPEVRLVGDWGCG